MKKILLFAICLCCIFLFGCDSESDIDPNSLIGMSKEDILRLVFKKCSKNANGEINIGIWEIEKNGKRSYQNFYYKSFKDAMNDTRLMDNNIWEIAKKHKFSISILAKVECLDLFLRKELLSKWKKIIGTIHNQDTFLIFQREFALDTQTQKCNILVFRY